VEVENKAKLFVCLGKRKGAYFQRRHKQYIPPLAQVCFWAQFMLCKLCHTPIVASTLEIVDR